MLPRQLHSAVAPKLQHLNLLHALLIRLLQMNCNCSHPSFCPKPDPGTVEIPVASSSFRQKKTSGDLPAFLAASIAVGGSSMRGNEYIAPGLQEMEGTSRKESDRMRWLAG